ncbi:MAG: GntR family transcriptional regulator [Firmicutes bacterium]|nr:GntR family transcriptional regulator [Bacillota bacterium]
MARENLKEKAYRIIKRKIVNCEYSPESFLTEAELMREIGTSRTPIREALNKLEQESLIRIIPKKGVIVGAITIREINDVYQIRELVEPYIIRTWGNKLSTETLTAFKEKLVDLADSSEKESYEMDDSLHRCIISVCENKYLVELMEKSYDQNHRIRIISGRLHSRLERSTREHINILNLLIARDMEGAAQAMSAHLESAKQAAVESFFQLK